MIDTGLRALRRHGRRTFLAHPETVGETYLEHLRVATGFGIRLLIAGGACLLHGLVPRLCTDTGSRSVRLLHDRLSRRRPAPSVASDRTTEAHETPTPSPHSATTPHHPAGSGDAH